MKKYAGLFAAIVLAANTVPVLAQVDLALWTFETSIPVTAGPFAAEGGINGATSAALGSHASGATVYSSPAGNGSAHSFSSNVWAIGDYYQFTTSSTGWSGIKVSWDQTSSATGPKDFQLQWSANGSPFTPVAPNYIVLPNAAPNPTWNSTTASTVYSYFYSLKDLPALDDKASISFRLVDISTAAAGTGAPGTGGTNRVDNFLIHANTQIPEPVSLALLAVGGLLVGRRRR